MEETIDIPTVKTVNDLLVEQKELIDKINKDNKSINKINEQIAGLKEIRQELKKNADVSKGAMNENMNAIQKLRNQRIKATESMVEFFSTFAKKSEEALNQVAKIYKLVEGDRSRNKEMYDKEIERLESKLKKDQSLPEDHKDKLPAYEAERIKAQIKSYKIESVSLEKNINDTEKMKKKWDSVVKINDASSTAIKNVVESLMKLTSWPSKDKKEEPEKKDDASESNNKDSEKKDKDSSGAQDTSISGSTANSSGESDDDTMTEEERTANIKANYDERLESAIGYAEAAKTAVADLDKVWDAIDESRLRKKQQEYDDDLLNLKEQLANGLIQEDEYHEKVFELDKKLSTEKAKIEREQAIRKKATSIFQIAMDTAVAIMKAWIDVPVWGAIPFTVAIAAMGAAQIAAIAATPIPKARKGGLIVGNSHENGGVLIEAEGGEAILTKKAVTAFPGMVALMNAAAAGGSIHDGGYAARSILGAGGDYLTDIRSGANVIDYKKLSNAISDNLKEMKIYIAVTDLNEGLKQYVQIDNMARL